jgi:hypothetical protein
MLTMQSTDISQEISALREQIAALEASIELRKRQQLRKSDDSVGSETAEADLGELVEARDFMVARLSRLESCKRTPDR